MIGILNKLLSITLTKPYFMIKTEILLSPRLVVEGKIVGKASKNGIIIGLIVKNGHTFSMIKYTGNVLPG